MAILLLACGAAIVNSLHLRAINPSHPPTYSDADTQALVDLSVPSSVSRVPSSWGCVANVQTACFTSSLAPLTTINALAAHFGVKEYGTTTGTRAIPTRYTMCTKVGTAPAFVLVEGRPSNAVLEGNTWIVPPGHQPHFAGAVVSINLTGSGHCP